MVIRVVYEAAMKKNMVAATNVMILRMMANH